MTVSADFAFDERGRVTGAVARRYFGASGDLERWGGRSTEWRTIRGVEIPTRGEVVWYLDSGEFVFFRYEIVDVETNPTSARREHRDGLREAQQIDGLRDVAVETGG